MLQASVIIPLYNKGPHVARAVYSVLNQTIQDFEIIIIDGNSDDEGPKMVQEIQDSRIIFTVQSGTGVSVARNQAVKMARAEFVTFLDADDEWTPKHLEILLRMREKFPEAGAYSTLFKICLSKDKIIPVCNRGLPKEPFEGILPNYFRVAALGYPPVWTSAVGMPKNIFFEFGGFPEGVCLGEDQDLWAKIALKYPIALSSEIGAIYHTEAVNRACNVPVPLTEEAVVKTGNAAIIQGKVPINLLADLKEYIAFKEISRARKNILTHNFSEARRILLNTRTSYHNNEKFFLLMVSFLPISVFHYLYSLKHSDFIFKLFGR
jgi:glycosyltransferase involved in cell wall biosynthesis